MTDPINSETNSIYNMYIKQSSIELYAYFTIFVARTFQNHNIFIEKINCNLALWYWFPISHIVS